MYCIIAVAVASLGLFFIVKRSGSAATAQPKPGTRISKTDVLLTAALLIIACVLWYLGNKSTLPAHDEIFSAFNSAGIHPFQAASYYMLPNNHVFFNLLNGVLFHAATDKVVTGRFISLAAYCGVVVVVFYWFRAIVKNPWLALLISIALALQCPVWGFSFQARGYELYLLASWGMVISLFAWLQSANVSWLAINALCCCTGYFIMPSFLYLHVAQLLFVLLYMPFYKTKETMFWKYQLIAAGITYLLYLPLLCFSGLTALAGNGYVAPMSGFKQKSLGDFLQWMWPTFLSCVEHIFSNVHIGAASFNLVLFLVPLALLFKRKNKFSVLFGTFYLVAWLVFFVVVIAMRRMPFERNLICHYSLAFAGVILVLEWFITAVAERTKLQLPMSIIFSATVCFFSYHFYTTNESFIKVTLYEHDINNTYNELSDGLDYIPPGSTVAFSDEGFFYRYVCLKNGCRISSCPTGDETYYVKQNYEPLPQAFAGNYEIAKTLGDHTIYKRK